MMILSFGRAQPRTPVCVVGSRSVNSGDLRTLLATLIPHPPCLMAVELVEFLVSVRFGVRVVGTIYIRSDNERRPTGLCRCRQLCDG